MLIFLYIKTPRPLGSLNVLVWLMMADADSWAFSLRIYLKDVKTRKDDGFARLPLVFCWELLTEQYFRRVPSPITSTEYFRQVLPLIVQLVAATNMANMVSFGAMCLKLFGLFFLNFDDFSKWAGRSK